MRDAFTLLFLFRSKTVFLATFVLIVLLIVSLIGSLADAPTDEVASSCDFNSSLASNLSFSVPPRLSLRKDKARLTAKRISC